MEKAFTKHIYLQRWSYFGLNLSVSLKCWILNIASLKSYDNMKGICFDLEGAFGHDSLFKEIYHMTIK